MIPKKLTAELSVAAQISAADVAGLAAQGFKSIICNRPDGEGPDQPLFAEIERAASSLGLSAPLHAGDLRQGVRRGRGQVRARR